MKKIYFLFGSACIILLLQSNLHFSSQPPTGHTGATGTFCTDCHSGNPLNNAGGSVALSGLPTTYTASQQYDLSLSITHSAANRTRWGFSIVAVNGMGTSIGTFSTTNANAATNGSELSHSNAVSTSARSTYSYNNLSWTAPSNTSNSTVHFYYVGNAANGSGSSGDFIYAGNNLIALPIELTAFTAALKNNTVILNWQSENESNSSFFEIERSDDGQFFFALSKIPAAGSSTSSKNYNFIDHKVNTNVGTIFYRLRMVDKDGTEKYSKTISINPPPATMFIKNIYPTIVKIGEEFTTELYSDKEQQLEIAMLSYSGKIVQTKRYRLQKGFNKIKAIAVESGFKGMMFIKYETATFKQTKSILVS